MFCLHYTLFYSRYVYEKEMLMIIMQSKAYSYFGCRITMVLLRKNQVWMGDFGFKICIVRAVEFK